MAFKGGTSLSKVYRVIDRFSEDVDITLDYRYFDINEDLNNLNELSGNQLRKLSDKLTKKVVIYVKEVILPYLQSQLLNLPENQNFSIDFYEESNEIYFSYPTLTSSDGYTLEYVLIELGGRNVVNPNETAHIAPYVADLIPELDFPCGDVIVLSGQRTFWEKVTLAHYECNRNTLRENADRLSRHWYDLVMLSRHQVGKNAINNRDLLHEVIEHKKIFFNSGYANYDSCLNGNIKLLPTDDSLKQLKHDYNNMLASNLMYQTPPSFEKIVEEIKELEQSVNSIM